MTTAVWDGEEREERRFFALAESFSVTATVRECHYKLRARRAREPRCRGRLGQRRRAAAWPSLLPLPPRAARRPLEPARTRPEHLRWSQPHAPPSSPSLLPVLHGCVVAQRSAHPPPPSTATRQPATASTAICSAPRLGPSPALKAAASSPSSTATLPAAVRRVSRLRSTALCAQVDRAPPRATSWRAATSRSWPPLPT